MITSTLESILTSIGRSLGNEHRMTLRASIYAVLAGSSSEGMIEALKATPPAEARIVLNQYATHRRLWNHDFDTVVAMCKALIEVARHHGFEPCSWWTRMTMSEESAVSYWRAAMLERKAYLAGEITTDEYGMPETVSDESLMNLQSVDSENGGE